MTDAHAMAPFPNAIVFNWATLIVLTFGNLGALDFQARCMAAKSAKIATNGCLISGMLCILLGVPFAYLGSIARIYYGPDSTRASYETDVSYTDVYFPSFAETGTH
jgi:Na+/proline symporter